MTRFFNKATINCRNRWALLTSPSYAKRGSGEFLGFALIAPLIITMICAIVAAAQIASANQTLSYTTYNCCRSAVVCESFSAAEDRANDVFVYQFPNADPSRGDRCELNLIGSEWKKGAYLQCTVHYYVDTFMPFISGTRTQTITMMIENGGD